LHFLARSTLHCRRHRPLDHRRVHDSWRARSRGG
jgi:hypothetical protein